MVGIDIPSPSLISKIVPLLALFTKCISSSHGECTTSCPASVGMLIPRPFLRRFGSDYLAWTFPALLPIMKRFNHLENPIECRST
jgi:hypothetical protein